MKKNDKNPLLNKREYTNEEKKIAKQNKLQSIIKTAKYMSMNEIEFKLSSTAGNYTLTSEHIKWRTFQAIDPITPKELGFLNKVRGYVKKNNIVLNFPNQYFEYDVQYMDSSLKLKGKRFTDVIEVDIDQAYWDTAYQLGILSKELYELGSSDQISKRARMVCLGSFAKKTYHYEFRGNQLINSSVEKSNDTENIWYTICKRVSDVMLEIKNTIGEDYIFFWVDGIYMVNNPESVKKAVEIAKKYNYQVKTNMIDLIEGMDRHLMVQENIFSEKKKRFNYVSRDSKRVVEQDKILLQRCLDLLKS